MGHPAVTPDIDDLKLEKTARKSKMLQMRVEKGR
jgi:hypothetical protein